MDDNIICKWAKHDGQCFMTLVRDIRQLYSNIDIATGCKLIEGSCQVDGLIPIGPDNYPSWFKCPIAENKDIT